MYLMKREQVGSLSLMIFDHDYYMYVHYEKPLIFIQYWQVLILKITCRNHSAREKKKHVDFLYNLYFDSYSECRKKLPTFKKNNT